MSTLPLDFRQVVVTRRPGSKGVVLGIAASHPADVAIVQTKPPRILTEEHARAQAALVLEALFELPPETRAQLYTMLAESSDTFCGVKPRGGRVYEPVKGGTRR